MIEQSQKLRGSLESCGIPRWTVMIAGDARRKHGNCIRNQGQDKKMAPVIRGGKKATEQGTGFADITWPG